MDCLLGSHGRGAVGSRVETWPYIGPALDCIRIHVERSLPEPYTSVWVIPRCPQCRKTGHPHVTRTGWRGMEALWRTVGAASVRHCCRCRVRWSVPRDRLFCSCHGETSALELVNLLLGKVQW